MSLVRLCYASRATFKPFTVDGMDATVADILIQARKNNQKNNLVGALYYGNGSFFQCLEGEEDKVNALLDKLKNDSRHEDFVVLSKTPIKERSFTHWEMKYAAIDYQVRAYLKEYGMAKFEPHKFTVIMVSALVDLLIDAQDFSLAQLRDAANQKLKLEHQPKTSVSYIYYGAGTLIFGLLIAFFVMNIPVFK